MKMRMAGPITLTFNEEFRVRQNRMVFENARNHAATLLRHEEDALAEQESRVAEARKALAEAESDLLRYCPDSSATARAIVEDASR